MTNLIVLYLNAGLFLVQSSCFHTHTASEGLRNESPSENYVANNKRDFCETIPFHFVIIRNDLQSETVRKIDVFLDSNAYSVANLTTLFSYLSNKYPEPMYLTIGVHTDWSQLDLPTDCPGSGSGGGTQVQERPYEYDFHRAIFYRRGENIFYRYSSQLKTDKLETIVIKGTAQGSPIWR